MGIDKARQELFKLIKSKAYAEGRFKLSSGKISDYYIDCRKVTLSSKGAFFSAFLILDMIKNKKIDAIGGPTIGADPLVGAVCALSMARGRKPLKAFLVRKEAKTHGLKRRIEGPKLKKGDRVLVIDDVATTGGSLIDTIVCLRKEGVKVDSVITLVDRNEGARQKLNSLKCDFIPIFNIKDFKKS
jgi:orotate phosphoribosyltransferase